MGQHKGKAAPAGAAFRGSGLFSRRSAEGRRGLLWAAAGVLFCLFAAYMFGGSEARGALCAAVAALLPLGWRSVRARLRGRVTPLVAAVTGFFLLSGLSALVSDFGWLSVREFSKLLAAFALFLLLLALVKEGQQESLLWLLAGTTAAYSLLSLDAAAAGVLFAPFAALLDGLGCAFGAVNSGFEEGTRITGIFGNANALGGLLAIGIFLSLYLCRRAASPRRRAAACGLLALNALGFFLAFSMGAILFFALCVLVFLLAAPGEERAGYFVLMFHTAVLTLLCAFLAYQGLGRSGGAAALVYLAAALHVALLWAVDHFVADRLTALLRAHGRLTVALVAGLVALAAAYLVAGFLWTGPYTLAPGERLERSAYPAAGEYTVTALGPEDLRLSVAVQTQADTMMHTSTTVYDGPASGATFAVPEGTVVAHFALFSSGGGAVEQVAYAGAEGGALKLNYRLLPDFVANRMQGLLANQNAIQRMVFWRDSLKLFAQSPLIGQGTAVYEGRLRSVQDFDYETRYPHNHYVQLMAEMGLVGLAAFVAVGVCGARALRGLRRTERAPLGAALAMLYGHAVVEATWSFGCYLAVALAVLAAIVLAQEGASPPRRGTAWALPAACVGVALLGLTVAGYVYADASYDAVKRGDKAQTPYTMTELARVDLYQGILYKLDMATNAATSEVPEFYDTAGTYAAQASRRHVYDFDVTLARYHYFPRGEWQQGMALLRAAAEEGGSVSANWQAIFALLEEFYDLCPDQPWYARQVLALKAQMDEFNVGRLGPVSLSEGNLAFVARMEAQAG